MTASITVILGFSCAGKSTFIKNLVTQDQNYAAKRPVYEFMFRSGEVERLEPGDIFHMDMSAVGVPVEESAFPLVEAHPLLDVCFSETTATTVIVLVAPESVIRERILSRQLIGIGFRRDDSMKAYPIDHKLKILNKCTLAKRYRQWFDFLDHKGIEYNIVRTDRKNYEAISSPIEALSLISEGDVSSSTRKVYGRERKNAK